MRTQVLSHSAIIVLFAGSAVVAHQHEGDIIVGRSGGNQLKAEFATEPYPLPVIDPGIPGLYEGWASDEPGLEGLETAEPQEDFYPLEPDAEIWLVATQGALDPALKLRESSTLAVAIGPDGGQWLIEGLHAHPIWHIDSLDAGFDPGQQTWQGTFTLHHAGGLYTDSEPFTLTFQPVPEPVSGLLLGAGSLLVLMPSRRRVR